MPPSQGRGLTNVDHGQGTFKPKGGWPAGIALAVALSRVRKARSTRGVLVAFGQESRPGLRGLVGKAGPVPKGENKFRAKL